MTRGCSKHYGYVEGRIPSSFSSQDSKSEASRASHVCDIATTYLAIADSIKMPLYTGHVGPIGYREWPPSCFHVF